MNKSDKNGKGSQVIYKQKSGYISHVNVSGDWIIFSLSETRKEKHDAKEITKYYICKIKTDGSCFEKLQGVRVEDLWVYKKKIYFSKFTKRGGAGITCVDFLGKKEEMIFDKENIWFEILGNKLYCMSRGDLLKRDEDCHLYQVELDRNDGEFQELMVFKGMSGKMDRVCTDGTYVYCLDLEGEHLYRTSVNDVSLVLLASDVSAFCVQDDRIYYTATNDYGADDKLCAINLDGSGKQIIYSGIDEKGYRFNGVFRDRGYFTSDTIKCVNTLPH